VNRLSILGIKPNFSLKQNSRAKLDTGKLCNYNCKFCYYRDQLDQRDSLDTILKRVDYLHGYGIEQIDLSGGESSIDKNWFEILDYCNTRFKHISCLSHGGRFHKMEFAKKSKEHGLKEVLFSVHGSNAEIHDEITERKGSFDRIMQAIENCQQIGIIIRINCTVFKPLLEHEYATLIRHIKPVQLNFIAINFWEDNEDFRKLDTEEYKVLSDSIIRCIDLLKDDVDEINVRYTPLCYMPGYEKYVVGHIQHVYDLRDWNKAMYDRGIDTNVPYTDEQKHQQAFDAACSDRLRYYHKNVNCAKCKYFYVCDGIDNHLTLQTFPVEGEKVTHVSKHSDSDT